MQAENGELHQQINELSSKINDFETSRSEAQSQLQLVSQSHTKNDDELHKQINGLTSKIKQLEISNSDAHSRLQSTEQTYTKNDQKLRQQLQQLQAEKEAIEQRLMETETTLNEMLIEKKNLVESTEQTEIVNFQSITPVSCFFSIDVTHKNEPSVNSKNLKRHL